MGGRKARAGGRRCDAAAPAAGRRSYIRLDHAGGSLIDTAAAARRWAEEWQRAWEEHDADRVGALYASGASFRSAPFRDLQDPREYAAWAFSDEESAEPHFREPALVDGDCAVVEWWAISRSNGREDTLAGVSLLRFDENGLVVEQRDYWNIQEGRQEL